MQQSARQSMYQWFNLALQPITQRTLGYVTVVTRLQSDPEIGRHTKHTSPSKRRIGGYCTPALHNLIDSPRRPPHRTCHPALGEVTRGPDVRLGYNRLRPPHRW